MSTNPVPRPSPLAALCSQLLPLLLSPALLLWESPGERAALLLSICTCCTCTVAIGWVGEGEQGVPDFQADLRHWPKAQRHRVSPKGSQLLCQMGLWDWEREGVPAPPPMAPAAWGGRRLQPGVHTAQSVHTAWPPAQDAVVRAAHSMPALCRPARCLWLEEWMSTAQQPTLSKVSF